MTACVTGARRFPDPSAPRLIIEGMPNSPEATSLDHDMTMAWAHAANCLLYENDPGPAKLNIGSADEPRMVTRSYAWQDAYAHFLLEHCEADWNRIHALADALRNKISELGGERAARKRRLLRPVDNDQFDEHVQCWRRALDLCEMALSFIEQAGAVDDEQARRRLLAGSKHGNAQLTIGALGMSDYATGEYLRELDEIDSEDQGR